MKLSVKGCYVLAWRSFAKWWIPLCLVSGIIVVFQIVPRMLVRADVNELRITAGSLMTAISEDDTEKLAAIGISWKMTRGNFWRLSLLVLMNTGIQLLALPTIVGGIPATGFVNTARAAAFRMIWEEGRYAKT